MTCYFRHLKEVFNKAGIKITPANRKEVDMVIHEIVGVNYPNCPAAWRQVKNRLAQDETVFISTLKEAFNNRK
jgi:predicted Fe-Mo cluster-binding NifX family protein